MTEKKTNDPVRDPNQPVSVPERPVQPADERDEDQVKSSGRQKKYDGGEIPRTHSGK